MDKIIIIILLVFSNNIFSQPIKVESKYHDIDSILFNLRSDKIRLNKGFIFIDRDTLLRGGVNIKKINKDKQFIWEKKFDIPLSLKWNFTYINCNFYVESIEKIYIWIQTVDSSKWIPYQIPITFNGYQRPFQININNFKISSKKSKIIAVRITAQKKNKTSKIILGDFNILTTKLKVIQYVHPLFDYSLSDWVNCTLNNSLIQFNAYPILLSHSAIYNSPNYQLEMIDADKEQLTKFFENTIKYYPFYKERNLDKNKFLRKYQQIIDTVESVENLISSYGNLVEEYNDVHFYLNKSPSKIKTYSPVKLVKLNNSIYVTSIFDTTLNLKKGDKVISKKGIPIDSVISIFSKKFVGRKEVQESYAIATLLNGTENEIINLQIIRDNDTISIDYRICKDYKIPNNFIPKHGDFKTFDKNIGYLRINNFDETIWYRYFSLDNYLSLLSALIFDVRGNKGGEEQMVYQIISTLISNNTIISNTSIPPFDNIETLCIKPNKFYSYKIPKIVVLIDEHSTCAAELFSYLLKKHCNAVLIGSGPTAGAYAMRVPVVLPDKRVLFVNSIIKPLFEDNYSFEGVGIAPDIWVWKNQINDLYPYEDKMLKTALRFCQQ